MLNVRDPECLRHILKDAFDKYSKPDPRHDWVWDHLNRFLGKGIFTALHGHGAPDGGALWLQQRKIAANIFTRKNFTDNMGEVFKRKAERLRDILEPARLADMQMHFFNYTMDNAVEIFFGEKSDIIGGEHNAYGAAFDEAHRHFFKYCVGSTMIAALLKFLPWPFGGITGIWAWAHHKSSDVFQRFESNVRILNVESRKIIDKCQSDPNIGRRRDLLALFLQEFQQEGLPKSQTTACLQDVINNFVIAGRDTTACALSWMFYILATNPDIQSRVLEEIDRLAPAGTEPTFKMLHHSNMPLLHALVYETLRLHPSVPMNGKEAKMDDVLPNGTRVPRGAKVAYFPWGMGRDPDVWPEPEKVKLERWVPFKQPPAHEFPVFQAGPRICLGVDMAIFEVKVVAVMLLQTFTFSMCPREAERVHYSMMITMSICNSKGQDSHCLWLTPTPRYDGNPQDGKS
jgi:cytochrome P450